MSDINQPYNIQGGAGSEYEQTSTPNRAPSGGVHRPELMPGKKMRDVPVIINCSNVSFIYETTGEPDNVLPFNPRRVALNIQNKGVASIYINFDADATDQHMEIAAGGNYEPPVAPINRINIRGAAVGDIVTVTEGSR